MKMGKENYLKYGEIVSKCWEDEEFKKKFIADPEAVFKEYGMDIPEGIEYRVIECPKDIDYVILPATNVKESVQEVAKLLLQLAEKSDVLIPEGTEIRVLQNPEYVSYVVLPASPKTLTEAELSRISGSGKTCANTEVEVEMVEVEAAATTTTHSVEAELVAVAVCAAVVI